MSIPGVQEGCSSLRLAYIVPFTQTSEPGRWQVLSAEIFPSLKYAHDEATPQVVFF